MILDLRTHSYDTHIAPYIRSGIIIDTSVFKNIIDGIIETRISHKRSHELVKIEQFLNLLKINNKWSKFFITPHVLAEVCNHVRSDYSKWGNYKEIINEIIPLIQDMQDKVVYKNDILRLIDLKNPIMEIGDLSIFVIADCFDNNKEKVAILSKDWELNNRYQDSKNVMILDYNSNIINYS